MLNSNQTANLSCSDCSSPEIPQLSIFGQIVLGILISILITIGFCGNVVVCLIVYRKPQMRSAINLLLANLALSDIFVSVLCMPLPLITLFNGGWPFGSVVCKIHGFLMEYFCVVATVILVIMSGDRYMIIVKRRDKLTARYAKIFIALIWVIPFIIVSPPLFGLSCYEVDINTQCLLRMTNNKYDLAFLAIKFTVGFLFPSLTMTYAFIGIGNAVRTNLFRVRNHPETELSPSIAHISYKLGFVKVPIKSKSNIDVKFKTRTFITILLLFIVMLVCISPHCFHQLISNTTNRFNLVTHNVVLWLALSKSAFNPIVYFLRIKKFREACGEVVPSCMRCKKCRLKDPINKRVNPSVLYQYHGESVTPV